MGRFRPLHFHVGSWDAASKLINKLQDELAVAINIGVSGTYTPTLTNVANLDASTAYPCQWLRVGDTVTVSGKVDVNPTAPATPTQLTLTLPVASNFANDYECTGVAFSSNIAGQGAAIRAEGTVNEAEMIWTSGDVTNQPMYFTFTYQVL